MVMGLVFMSALTVLSLLVCDITAVSLSPQQREFVRQWLLKGGQNSNDSDLKVVSNQALKQIKQPRLQRKSGRSHGREVLKAGYASAPQPAAAAPAQAPAPRVFVISAPAPTMQRASKPQPAPQSQPSYHPAPQPAAMAPKPAPQPAPSYSVAQAQPAQPAQAQSGGSYRVIYVQSPPEPARAAAKPRSPPAKPAAPSYPPPPPPPPPPPAQSSYPRQQSAPGSSSSSSSEPQALFIVVPPSASSASAAAMMAMKSAGYGVQQMISGYSQPALPPCPPSPGNFCYGKYVGHYEHPSDQGCYIVCNDFGRGFTRRCARGTKWKKHGHYGESSAPSGYNRCA